MEPAKDLIGKIKQWKTIYPAYIDSTKTIDQGHLL